MKKMIDELWDGEISPQDTLISDNQEYRELQHRQSKNKAELLEALSDEQKELLEKFCATEIELNGISEREAFVRDGLIYEDAEYHNAVFVGSNPDGVPCHAQKRSTSPVSDFKGNLTGSVAEYSFHFVGESEYLFVFEAPIDMLAYISMNKPGWEKHSYDLLTASFFTWR